MFNKKITDTTDSIPISIQVFAITTFQFLDKSSFYIVLSENKSCRFGFSDNRFMYKSHETLVGCRSMKRHFYVEKKNWKDANFHKIYPRNVNDTVTVVNLICISMYIAWWTQIRNESIHSICCYKEEFSYTASLSLLYHLKCITKYISVTYKQDAHI